MSLACRNGRLEVAKWLYGAGAAGDVRRAGGGGYTHYTPMLWACQYGHLEVTQWLYVVGAARSHVLKVLP